MDPDIQSILDKDSLESIFANIKFLDTQNGTRNNTLTDPIKTVQVGLEDMAVPEGMELKTIGVGPNQRQVLIQKDRPKGPMRALAGAWDVISGFDTDRQGGTRFNWGTEDDRTGYGAEWNEETKKKILEREGKADLSGNALPSEEKQKKLLEWNARQKEAQRIELAKDAELNNALAAKQIQTNTEALYPYLLRAQLDAQMSPYGQTIIRGRTGDLSASMKDATTRQLYAATQAAQAGLARPAGIRYANTA